MHWISVRFDEMGNTFHRYTTLSCPWWHDMVLLPPLFPRTGYNSFFLSCHQGALAAKVLRNTDWNRSMLVLERYNCSLEWAIVVLEMTWSCSHHWSFPRIGNSAIFVLEMAWSCSHHWLFTGMEYCAIFFLEMAGCYCHNCSQGWVFVLFVLEMAWCCRHPRMGNSAILS